MWAVVFDASEIGPAAADSDGGSLKGAGGFVAAILQKGQRSGMVEIDLDTRGNNLRRIDGEYWSDGCMKSEGGSG